MLQVPREGAAVGHLVVIVELFWHSSSERGIYANFISEKSLSKGTAMRERASKQRGAGRVVRELQMFLYLSRSTRNRERERESGDVQRDVQGASFCLPKGQRGKEEARDCRGAKCFTAKDLA